MRSRRNRRLDHRGRRFRSLVQRISSYNRLFLQDHILRGTLHTIRLCRLNTAQLRVKNLVILRPRRGNIQLMLFTRRILVTAQDRRRRVPSVRFNSTIRTRLTLNTTQVNSNGHITCLNIRCLHRAFKSSHAAINRRLQLIPNTQARNSMITRVMNIVDNSRNGQLFIILLTNRFQRLLMMSQHKLKSNPPFVTLTASTHYRWYFHRL